jgi:hypothetical protein
VIVFSVHAQGYKQCTDEPVGTYITPVPNFLQGYLEYYLQIQEDKGNEDFELPDAANYAYCTRAVIQNEEYWLQIGCSDGTTQSLSVNIYSDNTCTTRSVVDGYDDSNIDVSNIQVSPHKKEGRRREGSYVPMLCLNHLTFYVSAATCFVCPV